MGARETDTSAAIRRELIDVLESRRREIEDELVTRFRAAALAGIEIDADDIAWFRSVVPDTVSGMVTVLEEGDRWSGNLPPSIVAQIQYGAQRGALLEDVLRGFAMVGTVFFEFFAERIAELPHAKDALRYLASWQSSNQVRIMEAFATEYAKEVERLNRSPSRHLAERVEGLLAGGSASYTDLGYDLDSCHLGLIAVGTRAELECRTLAEHLGCDLLVLPREENTVWAWLGSPHQVELAQLERLVKSKASLSLAAGEPRHGLDGWRLTHREARAALGVAVLEPGQLVRYSNVALVADALRNDAMSRSLADRYLVPLNRHRDSEHLRTTMRAYLDRDCNAASAASALGVNRHTVQRRLKRIEEAIGEPLSQCRAELDVALRLERLTVRRDGNKQTPLGSG